MDKARKRFWIQLLVLIFILYICIIIALSVGTADLSVKDSIKILLARFPFFKSFINASELSEVYITIVWKVRMPRVLLAVLAGSGLAVVGACFQGLLRNPLADPHILGISSGAALGATIAIISGVHITFMGLGVIGLFAFLGAILTIIVVYRIAYTQGQIPIVNLLLTGTVVSSMLSAVISLCMSLNREQLEKVYLWTLGSFSAATWSKVKFLAVFIVFGCSILLLLSRHLDLISIGEETAESLGVDTAILKKILLSFASLIVAACVSVSGVIGFVGLIVPHCIRILVGSEHKRLLPMCLVGGAIFMLICDTLARTLTPPSELPVGVVTALFGAPYFIILLQHNKPK